jgi:hypothetical protein
MFRQLAGAYHNKEECAVAVLFSFHVGLFRLCAINFLFYKKRVIFASVITLFRQTDQCLSKQVKNVKQNSSLKHHRQRVSASPVV